MKYLLLCFIFTSCGYIVGDRLEFDIIPSQENTNLVEARYWLYLNDDVIDCRVERTEIPLSYLVAYKDSIRKKEKVFLQKYKASVRIMDSVERELNK